jgi:hypothetical protein
MVKCPPSLNDAKDIEPKLVEQFCKELKSSEQMTPTLIKASREFASQKACGRLQTIASRFENSLLKILIRREKNEQRVFRLKETYTTTTLL